MASLDSYPIAEVLETVRKINDRVWDRSGHMLAEIAISLPIEEARRVSAIALWIDVLITAEVRVEKDAEFSLQDIFWMIKEKTQDLKVQPPDDKWLWLVRREMKMTVAVEAYLDRYASRPKTKPNWKRGKKN